MTGGSGRKGQERPRMTSSLTAPELLDWLRLSCKTLPFGFGYGGASYSQKLLSKSKVADLLGKTSKIKFLLQVYSQLLRFLTSVKIKVFVT